MDQRHVEAETSGGVAHSSGLPAVAGGEADTFAGFSQRGERDLGHGQVVGIEGVQPAAGMADRERMQPRGGWVDHGHCAVGADERAQQGQGDGGRSRDRPDRRERVRQ